MAVTDEFRNTMEDAFKDVKLDATPAANAPQTTPEQPKPAEPPKPSPEQSKPVVATQKPSHAAPAAVADPDDEILSGKRNPRSDDFRRVKTKAKQLEEEKGKISEEMTKIKAEYEELKKKPAVNPAEVQVRDAELAKLREDLVREQTKFNQIAVEFVPEFNEKYEKRAQSVKESLRAVVGDKADEVFNLLILPDSKAKSERISEVVAEMDELSKGEIVAANRDLRQIQSDRNSEIKSSRERINQIAQEREAKSKAQMEQFAKAFDAEWNVLSKNNPLYAPKEGDNDWNLTIAERQKIAKAIYNGEFENPSQRARAAAAAASHNLLVSSLSAKDERIKALEEQLKSLQTTSPTMTTTQGKQTGNTGSFEEQFAAALAGR